MNYINCKALVDVGWGIAEIDGNLLIDISSGDLLRYINDSMPFGELVKGIIYEGRIGDREKGHMVYVRNLGRLGLVAMEEDN